MEKELLPIPTTGTGTYRRVGPETLADAGQGLVMPEERVTYKSERALSDFRLPGMMVKRAFDLAVSSSVLLLSAPVMGLIALAIKSGSRGPIFHNVFRTGKGFRVFKVYGFRTTKAGAQRMEENLTHIRGSFGTVDAVMPTQTRLGRLLRATGLDMLPMFLNVWLGDLSLVGNRPLPIQEAASLVDDRSATRFEVPAGIWGLFGRNEMKFNMHRDALLEAELRYVRERSFSGDLRILWHALRSRNKSEGVNFQERSLRRA